MLDTMKSMRFARKLALVPMAALLLGSSTVIAQKRDSEQVRNVSASDLAGTLPGWSDLVAVGEFGTPVELGGDPISLVRSRELDVDFTVQTVYKGIVAPGEVVTVRLRSDMLVYPGEGISRYEMRAQLWRDTSEQVQHAAAEVEALRQAYSSGGITRAERDDRIGDLRAGNRRLLDDNAELRRMQRRLIVSHGPTFYQRGGVIQPDTPYLVAMSFIDGNIAYYSLGEIGLNIFWDEFADDVGSELLD